MSLNFRYIDDCISDVELIIEEYLKDNTLDTELLFERIRSLNSEMRQVEGLIKKLDDMIRENKALGYRVSELEDKIIELNGR